MEAAGTSDGWPLHPEFKSTGTIDIPVFYPSLDEMKNFADYINKIEQAHHAHLQSGIAKIVPPPEYRPRKSNDYSDVDEYNIQQPVMEKIKGSHGIYTKTNALFRKSIKVSAFRKLAVAKSMSITTMDPKEIESYYWKHILHGEPIYGADTPGSLCDSDLQVFNINRLNTILDLLNSFGVKINGVNTVYLYFGMWKTTFPWHSEDMDLYSINYLHFGAPKFWYAISTDSIERFERLACQCFPAEAKCCKSFLRHKTFIISPEILERHFIKFGTMVQYANEFIITFPKGYHMGFNIGYNCAESTNFASDRWIDFGKNASVCQCRDDSVEIDMRPFVKKFYHNEYDAWFKYWYGERPLKSSDVLYSVKRQDISNVNFVKKEKRCSRQITKGSRGPHIEDFDRKADGSPHATGRISLVISKTVDAWKKEAKQLWSNSPVDFNAECEFNNHCAAKSPHCCICQYFVPEPLMVTEERLPASSMRLIGKHVFAKINAECSTLRDALQEDRLFRCCNCYVVVHAQCYSIGDDISISDMGAWKCARCRHFDELIVRFTSCHLCNLRGGALIPTSNNEHEYVHVICALMDRKTIFPDPVKLDTAYTKPFRKWQAPAQYEDRFNDEYFVASDWSSGEGKFECEYCLESKEGLLKCAMCDDTMFHTTCARLAGVSFEFRNWPDLVAAVCPEHNKIVKDSAPLRVNQKIKVAVSGSNKLVKGKILRIEYTDLFTINFLDRSWSEDIQPSDIIDCECSRIGCDGDHVSGAKIKLRWDDGMIYEGYFRNKYRRAMYGVRVKLHGSDSSHVLNFGREDIFAKGERAIEGN